MDYSEKRAHKRYIHSTPIRYGFQVIEDFQAAEMSNYCEGGLYFRANSPLRTGDHICILLEKHASEVPIFGNSDGFNAEVCFCNRISGADAPFYGVGVRFLQKISSYRTHKGQASAGELRRRAEAYLDANVGSIQKLPSGDVHRLVHELHVHQIELEMQNDELRRAQLEIELSRNRYSYLYDFAPVAYFTFNPKGRILEVNLTGAGLLGIERSLLINTHFSLYVAREHQEVFRMHRRETFRTGNRQVCEIKLNRRNGDQIYARMESTTVADADGEISQILTAAVDITDRLRMEKALQKAHKDLEMLVEARTAELAQANIFLKQEIAERRRLSYRFLKAQEEERRRIALELHDELGQDLSVLKLQVGSLSRQLAKRKIALKDPVENLSAILGKTIEKVRRISHELIPSVLVDLGLAAALRWQIQLMKKHSDIEISSNIRFSADLIPPEQQIVIYRIFQEIFTNIRKHARAKQVAIDIASKGRKVFFGIEDDGIGFDIERINSISTAERGLGLATMEERVKMLDGRFEIFSRIGKGTRIAFEIPGVGSPQQTALNDGGETNEPISDHPG